MTGKKQLCTFRLGEHFLGIEVERVQEVLKHQEMRRVPLAHQAVRGLINLRGQIVAAIELRRCIAAADPARDTLPMNVVVRDGDEVVSLLVDEIGEVIEVDDEMFEAPPDTMSDAGRELCRGVYKLDGELLLVLDVDRVIGTCVAQRSW